MNLQYDIIAPQELDLMFAKKDVDVDGFHLVIDCTGNTIAVKKVKADHCTVNLFLRLEVQTI